MSIRTTPDNRAPTADAADSFHVVQREGETYWTIAEKRLKAGTSQPTHEEILLMARWLRSINGSDDALRPGQRIFFSRVQDGVKG